MPKKAMDSLTESMFYVLMAFGNGPMCGIDIAEAIAGCTGGRLRIGPATLYTILGKFEKGELLLESKEISAENEVVFVCQQAGDYILGADIASVGTQLSQNTMIFYANGEYIAYFTVSGSNGQVAENLKRITLTEGQNHITVKYPQNALSIARLCIYEEK